MDKYQLQLSVDEINQILDALGDKPYASVFQLVSNIQQQTHSQLNQAPTPSAPAITNADSTD